MAMVTVPQTGPAVAEPDDEQELRLALVMNGGISLAIWMGGVTVEINRLVNGDDVYGEVLALTRTRVRVDVIAGASAGGINGAVLAAMISHDNPRDVELNALRQIWLRDGALGSLFRSPLQKAPPSVMRGDEFFLPELRRMFGVLTDGRLTSDRDYPLRLTLTTTLLRAASRGFADDFGSLIADLDHRGEFNFRRGEGLDDDFDKARDWRIGDRLALASRCSASFPAAFEPSWVPVGISSEEQAKDGRRPDMKGFVNFSSSRYCIDGGVLVNKPFRPAIRGIFAQPASSEHVRRVLAYVVPDPSTPETDAPDTHDAMPTMAKVLGATGVSLPRAESVSRELEDIAEHNRRVQAQRLLRDHLLSPDGGGPVDIEALAARLLPAFREIRMGRLVDRLTTAVDPYEGRFDGLGQAPWDTTRLRDLIEAEGTAWLVPDRLDVEAPEATTAWRWGNETIETLGGTALDVVGRAFSGSSPASTERAALTLARATIHAHLRSLRVSVLGREPAFWKEQAAALRSAWLAAGREPVSWLPEPFETWLRTAEPKADRPAAIAGAIAATVLEAAPALRAVSGADLERKDPLLDRLVGELVPEGAGVDVVLRRLLAETIVQTVAAAGQPELDQVVELLQVSSTVPNGFDDRAAGADKLAGRQLGHFGAFYKRSWRANDWMWGRLDGAARLAQMIVDPARLAELGWTPEEATARLERVALGPEGDEAGAVLGDGSDRGWDRDRALAELSFLADPDAHPPRSLPVCARAVARRLQLRILQEELPFVADAIEFDVAAGGQAVVEAQDFSRAVARARRPPSKDGTRLAPVDAIALFRDCAVGRERILDEAGSDLFTTTVATAAAVGITALSGGSSGLKWGRSVVSALRAPFLWLWIIARNAVSPQRTGFAVLTFLLAAGGSLLAVSALGNVALPSVLAGLGTVLLLAGVALALLRSGLRRGLLFVLLVFLVIVAFLSVPSIVVHQFIDPRATGVRRLVRTAVPPAMAIVGLILGGLLLGAVHAPEPRRRRRTRSRP